MTGQKRIFIWEIVFRGEREDSRKPSHCGQDRPEFKIHWVWRRGGIFRGRGDRLEEKHKGSGEKSNFNQGCLGMLLVTLGILTHIRFLRVFVSEYLIYCWLVWTEGATNWFVEIGYSLVCLVSDFDYFICHWCLRKYLTPRLNVIMLCFSRLNPFCIVPSTLNPWINTWSGGYLCLLINTLCSFLLRVLLHFYYYYYYFICSIFLSPHGVRILAFVFGCALGNDGSVDMRGEVCNNPSVFRILENSGTCW